MEKKKELKKLTDSAIIDKIFVIRGQRVMLDKDLAELYDVEVKRLNEAVKRNAARFPEDFMFQLSQEEWESLRSQIATSNKGRGGQRYFPYAFTEQGVAMLSSVLRSEIAIHVNIQIIRVYTKVRQFLIDNKELWRKVEDIEKNLIKKDEDIQAIFELLKELLVKEEKPREPIGFKIPTKKK